MEIPLLYDLIVIYALSIGVIYVCHRCGLPPIVGFILTGVLCGPQVLGLVQAAHEVEILAEIGVVLLLFTIGMEFSFGSLLQLRKSVLLGGPLQVGVTCLVFFAWARQGQSMGEAVFLGFLASLSSTAIVLKTLQTRAEVEAPHGATSLGILIFQDIIVVPMMLVTPMLAGASQGMAGSLFTVLLKGLLIVGLALLLAKWGAPHLLYQIARTRNRELFLLTVVVLCFAVAWATAAAGLSLALGAFLAGLVISETEYSHEALGNILPFRDLFASIFFVSIGMLLDVQFLLSHPLWVGAATVVVLAAKSVIAGLAALVLGFPVRIAVLVGLTLSQVGEFSFVLSRSGLAHGVLSGTNYQLFLNVTVLTMGLTPLIMAVAPKVAAAAGRLPLPARLRSGLLAPQAPQAKTLKDHLIMVGYGVTGRNVSRAAQLAGVPYVIIEMNPETVRRERAAGEPVYYGDATHAEILELARIQAARIVVLAINDPVATRRITEMARKLNHKVYIIVRTRYLSELKPLFALGANEVVPEEFETSVEIFARVLRHYLVPRDEIGRHIAEVRANSYQMLRGLPRHFDSLGDLQRYLQDVEIATVRLSPQAPQAGKSLAETELRKKFGITVLAVRRDSQLLFNPEPDEKLQADDLLIILGAPDKIAAGGFLFSGG